MSHYVKQTKGDLQNTQPEDDEDGSSGGGHEMSPGGRELGERSHRTVSHDPGQSEDEGGEAAESCRRMLIGSHPSKHC